MLLLIVRYIFYFRNTKYGQHDTVISSLIHPLVFFLGQYVVHIFNIVVQEHVRTRPEEAGSPAISTLCTKDPQRKTKTKKVHGHPCDLCRSPRTFRATGATIGRREDKDPSEPSPAWLPRWFTALWTSGVARRRQAVHFGAHRLGRSPEASARLRICSLRSTPSMERSRPAGHHPQPQRESRRLPATADAAGRWTPGVAPEQPHKLRSSVGADAVVAVEPEDQNPPPASATAAPARLGRPSAQIHRRWRQIGDAFIQRRRSRRQGHGISDERLKT